MPATRRKALLNALAGLAVPSLGGCIGFGQSITALCPEALPIDAMSPLTIDTHVHIFNGSDIQVEAYIDKVRAQEDPSLKGLGSVLAELSIAASPDGRKEIAVLRQLGPELASACRPNAAKTIALALAEEQHQIALTELGRALAQAQARPSFRSLRGSDAVANAIKRLPQTFKGLRSRRAGLRSARAQRSALDAALNFVLHQLQYRFVNLIDYLDLYETGSTRQIDLLLCHMLDFDWPIGGGQPTVTSGEDQVAVMEQIAILTGGRAHGYVPFDPMRQVAYSLHLDPVDPLALVQSAVGSRGCIGVKLYPPIGFAPCGNALHDDSPGFWNKSWIRPEMRNLDKLGAKLDDALLALYRWCVAAKVPIMLHTSRSNGPSNEFKALTDATYWKTFPDDVARGLMVSFGHFGDTDLVGAPANARVLAFSELMGRPGQRGAEYYADSAYFTHNLDNSKGLADALLTLLKATAGRQDQAPLAERLMYGSDWEMLLIEGGNTGAYLRNFKSIFAKFDQEGSLGVPLGKLSGRFFGLNAARHLRLRPTDTDSTRGRLNAFYASRGVPKPAWAAKVDNLASSLA